MKNKILQTLLQPFGQNFLLLLVTFICSAITECIGFAVFESVHKSLFLALHHFVYCYFIILLYGLLPIAWRQIYKWLVIFLLLVNFVIDIICIYGFNFTFDKEIPTLIFGTNSNEATEFISSFFSFSLLFMILGGIFVTLISFYIIRNKQVKIHKILQYVGLLGVFVSVFLTTVVVESKNWFNVSLGKVVSFVQVWNLADVNLEKTNPTLVSLADNRAKNIVLIIGESLAKSHCSIYAYDKQTNPLLQKLRDDGNLFVFQNVEAPALNTVPSFKCLMSTYEYRFGDSISWYKCTTLPELLNKAHYKSFWISNQAQRGANDNVVAKYAELFDLVHFTGNRFHGKGKADLDETVLEKLPDFMNKRDSLSLFVFHLLGSHPKFECRYPESYAKFKVGDYQDKLEGQRENLAAYDNSVLYNDYVVSEIMQRFKDEEAIVFYFPDHGLDIYETRDDYAGHSNWNDPKSVKAGKDIPFMIYCSSSFMENNKSIMDNIKNSLNRKIFTENILYTVLNLANYKMEGQDMDEQHCLFLN